jgi:uncharacterized protein
MFRNIIWVCLATPFILASCATYNNKISSYYAYLQAKDYDKALSSLESNKFLKRNRNELLYHLEAGKLYRLQNNFAKSNEHLNIADNLMESNRRNVKDVAIGNLLNPGQETYRGEDHEKFLMHYYKALNYAALGKVEDVVVEARRITLANNTQEQQFTKDDKRYSADAFSINLQGMAYEMAGDYNNAFIAYRNALELFEKNNGSYYGVQQPQQLKLDVVRMAQRLGLTGSIAKYVDDVDTQKLVADTAGALILFIEEGQAPIKQESNFVLTSAGNGANGFAYVDQFGVNNNFNFNNTSYGIADNDLAKFRTLRVVLPSYTIVYNQIPSSITVSAGNNKFSAQPVQNLNNVMINVMKEKFLREMGKALARQITKKLVEEGAEFTAEKIAERNKKIDRDSTLTDEQKKEKKKDKAKKVADAAGFAVNIFNAISERADTRNWQSLPAFINYVRIPLKRGENNISIKTSFGEKTISVTGNGRLQMQAVVL